MRALSFVLLAVMVLALVSAASGCGKKRPKSFESADAAVKGFVQALRAGKIAEAAGMFDYTTYARANNENWDSIPKGQRLGIVNKLKERKVAALTGRFGSGAKDLTYAAAGAATGDTAYYTVSRGGADLGVVVVAQSDEGWKIEEAFGSGAEDQ